MDNLNEQQEQELQNQATDAQSAADQEQGQQTEQVEQVTQETPAPVEAEDIETLKKRLADTQAWGHQNAQELAEFRRQERDRQAASLKSEVAPEVLDQVRKANQVIEFEAQKHKQDREDAALKAMQRVVPDVFELNGNPLFAAELDKEAKRLEAQGVDLLDPVIAAAAAAAAKSRFEQSHARHEAERQETSRKSSKLAAMDVPGSGSSSGSQSKGKSEAEMAADIWNMSDADFAKLQKKTLGFN